MFVGDNGSEWMKHWVKGGHNYYYNLKTGQGTWDEPSNLFPNNTQLNKEEIQVVTCTFTIHLADNFYRSDF